MEIEPNQPKKTNTARVLVTVLNLVSLGPWVLMVFVSFFAFDAPGSENNRGLWAFVISIWIYPIPLFLCMLIGHFLYRKNKNRAAFIVQLLPMVVAVLEIAILIATDLILSANN